MNSIFKLIGMEMFNKMVSGIAPLIYIIFGIYSIKAGINDCTLLSCHNKGTPSEEGGICHCECPYGTSGLLCEYILEESLWPTGPYLLPRSKYGCPEVASKGWESGYIIMTLNQSLYSFYRSDAFMENITAIFDIFYIDTNSLIETYDRGNFFRMDFCYKDPNTAVKEHASWPTGKYQIYSADGKCPTGFTIGTVSLYLPPVKTWNADGQLPYFILTEETNVTYLRISVCNKDMHNTSDVNGDSPFMLIKHDKFDCPSDGENSTDDIVSVQDVVASTDSNNFAPFLFCLITPVPMHGPENTGNISDCNTIYYYNVTVNQTCCNLDEITSDIKKTCDNSYMLTLDVGRAIYVSGLLLNVTENSVIGHIVLNGSAKVYVSNEVLPSNSAILQECQFKYLQNTEREALLYCQSPVLGRFTTLIFERNALCGISPAVGFRFQDILPHIVSCPTNGPDMCAKELGMEDESVKEYQLSATTNIEGHEAVNARPRLRGWCPALNDMRPFLQIDLLAITRIEGIKIFNSIEVKDMSSFKSFCQVSNYRYDTDGCELFYGTTTDMKVQYRVSPFKIDLSLNMSHPQIFWFPNPFLARFVRVYPNGPISEIGRCLRVELLGCKQSLLYSRNCADDSTAELFKSKTIAVPVIGGSSIYTNTSQERCDEYCIGDKTCVGLQYATSNDTCFTYSDNIAQAQKNYRILEQNDQDQFSLLNCWQSQTELQNVNGLSKQFFNADVYRDDGVFLFTSPGFPFEYPKRLNYKWELYALSIHSFFKLTFTHFNVRSRDEGQNRLNNFQQCSDVLYIRRGINPNTYILGDAYKTHVFATLGEEHNNQLPVIATDATVLSLSFTTCEFGMVNPDGILGFRLIAVLTKTPSCSASDNSVQYCLSKNMRLSYNQYIGHPQIFKNLQFIIHGIQTTWLHGNIFGYKLIFEDFDVSCHNDWTVEFQQNNFYLQDPRYCNLNRPFHAIYISSRDIVIIAGNGMVNAITKRQRFTISYEVISANERDNNEEAYKCSPHTGKCYSFHMYEYRTWIEASEYCSSQNKTLVTIWNTDELMFIKGMLRNMQSELTEFIIRGGFYMSMFIGLFRYVDEEGKLRESWVDGRPVYFSAWQAAERTSIAPNANIHECAVIDLTFDFNRTDIWRLDLCTTEVVGRGRMHGFACESRQSISDKRFKNDFSTKESFDFPTKMSHMLFRCDSGETVSNLAVCNGLPECFDQSDERNCSAKEKCDDGYFKCDNGECIKISQVCDFIQNCLDASDEFCEFPPCNPDSEFTCNNGQCISREDRCDASFQCLDKSDEHNCAFCNDERAFKCSNRQCIPKQYICDDVTDCLDQSDEKNCHDDAYVTCDDVLAEGHKSSGLYYMKKSGPQIHCHFDKFNKTVRTVYLNIDWKGEYLYKNNGLGAKFLPSFRFEEAFIFMTNASRSGYVCSMEFPFQFIPEIKEVMKVEYALNDTSFEEIDEYPNGRISDLVQDFATRRGINLGPMMEETAIFMLENPKGNAYLDVVEQKKSIVVSYRGDFDDKVFRFDIGPIVCEKESDALLYNGSDVFPCGNHQQPTSLLNRCHLSHDSNGQMQGCRNFEHLQNCDSFECRRTFTRCPGSFCIPTFYVCDGKVDCPNGDDEKFCGCEEEKKTIIVLSYGYSRADHELAFKFASKFVNDHRPAYLLKVMRERGTLQYALFERRFPSDHIAISELWSSTNSTYVVEFLSKSSNVLVSFLPTQPYNNLEYELLYNTFKITGNASFFRIVNEETSSLLRNQNLSDNDNTLPFSLTEVRISSRKRVVYYGWNLIPNVCTTSNTHTRCVNGYRCARSLVCLNLNQICDGVVQCPNGDDERLCNYQCPQNCSCEDVSIVCSDSNIGWADVNTFPDQIMTLKLGPTNDDHVMNISKYFYYLVSLNVSYSGIKEVSGSSLNYLPNIKVLDISYNKLKTVKRNTFVTLKYLTKLVIKGNEDLLSIEPGAFNNLKVDTLSFHRCGLMSIEEETFKGLKLKELDLSQNSIRTVSDLAFKDVSVHTLNLMDNPLSQFGKDMFQGIRSLSELQTPSFKFCCIRPSYLLEEKCYPRRDEISSCDDLIVNSALQALLWVTGILAVLGNILSLLFRFLYDRQKLKKGYGIFVSNLAIADLLMGLYMLIIGIADTKFRGRYIEFDERWRTSAWCHLAGVLSTLSSEAGVLFICLITLDRILVIKYPFGQVRFSTASAVMTAIGCWTVSFLAATIPLIPGSYFDGRFYTSRAVCTALPLTRDRQPGWSYSIAMFIGFNFVSFVFIAFGQSWIFYEIRKASSRRKHMNVTLSNDMKVARNLLMVVTTDFLCWFPVGLMGMLALFDVPIPGEAYAWTVVLVLPINSALNPFLYTLSILLNREPAKRKGYGSHIATDRIEMATK